QPGRKRQPVHFDSQGGPESGPPGAPAPTLARPEVQRRTLPGHTIITGIADADVVSVTLATPRDVRTLRPSGPQHALIAVYDGEFFRGAITATVRLSDGRSVSEVVPNGPGGVPLTPPPTPSLAARLRLDRITLAGMRREVATEQHASPRLRAKLYGGVGLAQLAQGLRDIRSIVDTEQARMAYLSAHPGALPAE
ncbi:MAG TPA: hypothetical protein VNZ05_00405, partial [Solirubrobacteraceae bacterium]|nr:hypothetical protein [Solirubrobacteraceae bacterium]